MLAGGWGGAVMGEVVDGAAVAMMEVVGGAAAPATVDGVAMEMVGGAAVAARADGLVIEVVGGAAVPEMVVMVLVDGMDTVVALNLVHQCVEDSPRAMSAGIDDLLIICSFLDDMSRNWSTMLFLPRTSSTVISSLDLRWNFAASSMITCGIRISLECCIKHSLAFSCCMIVMVAHGIQFIGTYHFFGEQMDPLSLLRLVDTSWTFDCPENSGTVHIELLLGWVGRHGRVMVRISV